MTFARALATSLLLLALATPWARARDVQMVVAQTKAAAGGVALDGLRAIRITYRLRQSGLEGTGTTLTDVVTGRTVTRFKLGPMLGAEGFDGRRAWFQDTAGIVTVPEGGDRPAQTASQQYRNALAYWYPARAPPSRVAFRVQLFRGASRRRSKSHPRAVCRSNSGSTPKQRCSTASSKSAPPRRARRSMRTTVPSPAC